MGATIMHFVGVGKTQKASLNTQQVQLSYLWSYFHFAKKIVQIAETKDNKT